MTKNVDFSEFWCRKKKMDLSHNKEKRPILAKVVVAQIPALCKKGKGASSTIEDRPSWGAVFHGGTGEKSSISNTLSKRLAISPRATGKEIFARRRKKERSPYLRRERISTLDLRGESWGHALPSEGERGGEFSIHSLGGRRKDFRSRVGGGRGEINNFRKGVTLYLEKGDPAGVLGNRRGGGKSP